MTKDTRPILRRCVWCKIAHLMDSDNQAIPGPADDYAHYQYSDGCCREAEEILDKEIKEREQGQ